MLLRASVHVELSSPKYLEYDLGEGKRDRRTAEMQEGKA